MPTLEGLIGHSIVIRSVPLHEEHPVKVKLVGIENGGLWIESQDATNHWLAEMKQQATPKTLVWFLPYAQIAWIMGSGDYPALSEKAFGL